jgi:hypothetical protein
VIVLIDCRPQRKWWKGFVEEDPTVVKSLPHNFVLLEPRTAPFAINVRLGFSSLSLSVCVCVCVCVCVRACVCYVPLFLPPSVCLSAGLSASASVPVHEFVGGSPSVSPPSPQLQSA